VQAGDRNAPSLERIPYGCSRRVGSDDLYGDTSFVRPKSTARRKVDLVTTLQGFEDVARERPTLGVPNRQLFLAEKSRCHGS
jgi:hypothetical protein